MDTREVQFSADDAKALAIFLATLTREGVTYTVRNMAGGAWAVVLTGGF